MQVTIFKRYILRGPNQLWAKGPNKLECGPVLISTLSLMYVWTVGKGQIIWFVDVQMPDKNSLRPWSDWPLWRRMQILLRKNLYSPLLVFSHIAVAKFERSPLSVSFLSYSTYQCHYFQIRQLLLLNLIKLDISSKHCVRQRVISVYIQIFEKNIFLIYKSFPYQVYKFIQGSITVCDMA